MIVSLFNQKMLSRPPWRYRVADRLAKATTRHRFGSCPGKLLDNGNRGTLSVAVGDVVIYGKYGGSEVEVETARRHILRESDILAKVLALTSWALARFTIQTTKPNLSRD